VRKTPATSKNAGRSTTGEPRVPYYVQAPHIEAAKHLRLTVTRYIKDRALFREIEDALDMLRDVAGVRVKKQTSMPAGDLHPAGVEAARRLRCTVSRYIKDRATLHEIVVAMDMLRRAMGVRTGRSTDSPASDRHLAYVEADLESFRRGGSTRTAVCLCGWRGPQRGTLELVTDDALTHERSQERGGHGQA